MQCRRAAVRLDDGSDQTESQVRQALHAVHGSALTSDERAWRNRLKQFRRMLADSSEPIQKDGIKGTSGDIYRVAASPESATLLLFHLVRALQPNLCLELGTSLGVSAAYQAAALSLNGHGRLVTLERYSGLAAFADEYLRSLGLSPDCVTVRCGFFSDVLETVLVEARAAGGIGLAFVDGHHDGAATVRYFGQLLTALAHPAVIVFDDIRWSLAMRRAWLQIASDPRAMRAIDLWTMGIVIVR